MELQHLKGETWVPTAQLLVCTSSLANQTLRNPRWTKISPIPSEKQKKTPLPCHMYQIPSTLHIIHSVFRHLLNEII